MNCIAAVTKAVNVSCRTLLMEVLMESWVVFATRLCDARVIVLIRPWLSQMWANLEQRLSATVEEHTLLSRRSSTMPVFELKLKFCLPHSSNPCAAMSGTTRGSNAIKLPDKIRRSCKSIWCASPYMQAFRTNSATSVDRLDDEIPSRKI